MIWRNMTSKIYGAKWVRHYMPLVTKYIIRQVAYTPLPALINETTAPYILFT